MKRKKPNLKVKPKIKSMKKRQLKTTKKKPVTSPQTKVIDTYNFISNKVPITVTISKKSDEFVLIYEVSIAKISKHTLIILEKIRQELVTEVSLGMLDITDIKRQDVIEKKFTETIEILVKKHFPDISNQTAEFFVSYLIQKSLGMGEIEILMDDDNLEEVVVNSSEEPIWVYHKKHGWLKTDIFVENEEQIKHYASMLARKIGRQISVLEPLLDAHLETGDRANATLAPVSNAGNTITLRRFARDPFTVTNFIKFKTISPSAAALIWLAIQFELSGLITGGTASGKTATLNVLANFFPPNQRIISIEDTRELRLPKFLHWIPLTTRLPNPEGKGEITMQDLLVNSLRMRPDRILVGEVRRQAEAETLFEAIHTGHSVYATLHANDVDETLKRLLNPPINVPESMLPAISLIINQYRNRRTGIRRTFQIAEILPDSSTNILQQYDIKRDVLRKVNKSRSLMRSLELYTGYSRREINKLLLDKEKILKYMVKQNIENVDSVGKVMAEYYTNKDYLMKFVRANKPFR